MIDKFKRTRFAIQPAPVGTQVTMQFRGVTLLGDVTACYADYHTGNTMLRVRHFNGEEWPIDPHLFAVDILPRQET